MCYGPNEWGTECGQCSKCVTGRQGPQPNILEPPSQLLLGRGTVWHRKRDGRVVRITGVNHRWGRVHYETVTGVGACPLAIWRERFSPAPMTGAECVPPKVVQVDFSELERRVIEALGLDIPEPRHKTADFHRLRAAEIFDVKPSDVTPAMRRVGKAANLISVYVDKEKFNV